MLPIRIQAATAWSQMNTYLLETISNPREMVNVANINQHSYLFNRLLTKYDTAMEKEFGKPLPSSCQLSLDYTGPDRIFLPANRSSLKAGEDQFKTNCTECPPL